MRWSRRGREQYFIKTALFAALFSQDKMAVMNRIECTAEDANVHYRFLHSLARAATLARPVAAIGPDDRIAANYAF